MSNDNSNMSMSMPMPMDNMHNMAMHMMSFYWGKDVVLLFAGWPGFDRLGMYVLALAAVFVVAVGAEIMSVAAVLMTPRRLTPAMGALIHAVAFAVRMGFVYLLMLCVMSYNVGVFVAAVAGHALGCFLVKYQALTAVARAHEDSAPKL